MDSTHIDPLLSALASVLRKHRRALNISQEELAHRAGRSMRYISLLETGKHQPTLDTLRRMSSVFDVPLSQLILEAEKDLHAKDM
ncbi:helix-turn-helix domain-containing protein [Sulfitobacter sp. M13]|tara:strand:- start:320 stop:574 length:255 start_codon:yes stop_codon:yes gene_type:complete